MPEASILFVNYFSEDDILSLSKAISDAFQDEIEILIVDNSGSFPRRASEKIQCMRIIDQPSGNIGFGRAMNIAAANSTTNYIFLVNPDVILSDLKVLTTMIERLKAAPPSVGAVSCRIVDTEGIQQHVAIKDSMPTLGGFFVRTVANSLPRFIRRSTLSVDKNSFSNGPEKVVGFYAPFVLFRKHSFIQVGGFDPDFFMYCEDTEFFRRRYSSEWECWFYNDLVVTHVARQSDRYGLMDTQQQASYLLYLRKFSLAYLAIYLVIKLPRSVVLLAVRRHRKEAFSILSSLRYLPSLLTRKKYGDLERNPFKIKQIQD